MTHSERNLHRMISEGRGVFYSIANRDLGRCHDGALVRVTRYLWTGTAILTKNCVHTHDPRLRRYGMDGTTGQGDRRIKYSREQCNKCEIGDAMDERPQRPST